MGRVQRRWLRCVQRLLIILLVFYIQQRFRQSLGRPVAFTKRPVPWCNEACTNAVREKPAAFSRHQHRGDPQCLDAFRRCRVRARRVLKEAQRVSWKAYVLSINVHTPLTDVFNKVRRIAGKYPAPSPPVLSAGRTVADPKTVAEIFAEHFAGRILQP
ncbi:hypothetical protein E2C01_058781 [Portunus trituberculatus]|uniref:Uncharacterized protein n=1 Tax=Portunus trituberculatus TaxID=210409 RepID=A0A5B7H0R7_PORTR|nr:hypothetical protein [Portunus trituberculatus]